MHSKEKLFETLSLGIYHRFRDEDKREQSKRKKQGLPLKVENSIMFESFVADIMQDVLGGRAKVTEASGDYGVDIVHTLPNRDVYLVQVKCYKPENKISFDPLAVLHSNIITRNAQGAYFVTTSDYSPQATQFAEVHGIKLINGYELAQYWMGAKESWIDAQPATSMDKIFNGLEWTYEKLSEVLRSRMAR